MKNNHNNDDETRFKVLLAYSRRWSGKYKRNEYLNSHSNNSSRSSSNNISKIIKMTKKTTWNCARIIYGNMPFKLLLLLKNFILPLSASLSLCCPPFSCTRIHTIWIFPAYLGTREQRYFLATFNWHGADVLITGSIVRINGLASQICIYTV